MDLKRLHFENQKPGHEFQTISKMQKILMSLRLKSNIGNRRDVATCRTCKTLALS